MNLLCVRQLAVRIGALQICRGLDFDLEAGQRWALLGANGAGKTTLLHVLAGLRRPQAGTLAIKGSAPADLGRRELARRVGILFQDSQDAFPGTVLETALRGRHPHLPFWALEGQSDLEIVRRALCDVELEDLAARRVDTLSGGERRRLAIATLIVQRPEVWLLDEPANHLDLRHQVTLLARVAEHVQARSGAMMAALHDVNLALRFCTHALLLVGESEVVMGPVAEVINEANLERLYRYPIHCLQSDEGRRFYVPA